MRSSTVIAKGQRVDVSFDGCVWRFANFEYRRRSLWIPGHQLAGKLNAAFEVEGATELNAFLITGAQERSLFPFAFIPFPPHHVIGGDAVDEHNRRASVFAFGLG